jgi:uncharacterized protein YbjT (DUF2867 family)
MAFNFNTTDEHREGNHMNKESDTILVMGATGQQGGVVARALLAEGYKVRAMTRNPDGEKAQALAGLGAEVVRGDFDSEDSVLSAMSGVWGAFAVQNTWEAGVEGEEEQGKRVARLAKQAGVQHFVYTSVSSAQHETGIPHFDNKFRVEETIRELGLPSYTIIRPVFFMENFLTPWFKPPIDEGNLAVGIKPDTRVQMIAAADVGRYGLLAFEKHEELNGQAIDIAGDEMSMTEAAAIITDAVGREVNHFQVPIESVREFSEDFALMLEWFDAVGYSVDIEKTADQYGISPTPFTNFVSSVDWS